MLQLAVTQQKDARVMKVASIIALVYLPASLVASLFSTELFALNSVVLDIPHLATHFDGKHRFDCIPLVAKGFINRADEPRFTSVALRCSRSS
jgi:predicted acyltransferase